MTTTVTDSILEVVNPAIEHYSAYHYSFRRRYYLDPVSAHLLIYRFNRILGKARADLSFMACLQMPPIMSDAHNRGHFLSTLSTSAYEKEYALPKKPVSTSVAASRLEYLNDLSPSLR